MPEGDTVFRAAGTLHRALAGKKVTRFEMRTYRGAPNLVGEPIEECVPVGKHLLLRIGSYTVHSHLKMEGKWEIYRPGQRWRKPAYKARLIVGVDDCEAVGFELAQVRVVPRDREDLLVGHLGPDILSPDWGTADMRRVLASLAEDTHPVHVALLDQRTVAGFGNVYANELCFLGGVDPATPANTVDLEPMLKLGRKMIVANSARWERTTTGDARPGKRLYVYGRARRPCVRCQTTISFTRLGADVTELRDVYWCPHCQR